MPRNGLASILLLCLALLGITLTVHPGVEGGRSRHSSGLPSFSQAVRVPASEAWSFSVLKQQKFEAPVPGYWVGIKNVSSAARVVCLRGLHYGIVRRARLDPVAGMAWPRLSHACDRDSQLRRVVLPGETYYEYARIDDNEDFGGSATTSFFLYGCDFGGVEEEYAAGNCDRVRLDWSGPGATGLSEAPEFGRNELSEAQPSSSHRPISGPLERRDSRWSLVVRTAQAQHKAEGVWRYWVGVRNDLETAQTVATPAISHELKGDGGVENEPDMADLSTALRNTFLVLPGQTLFTMKKIAVRRLTGRVQLTLRVSVTEVSPSGWKLVPRRAVSVEWSTIL